MHGLHGTPASESKEEVDVSGQVLSRYEQHRVYSLDDTAEAFPRGAATARIGVRVRRHDDGVAVVWFR